MAWLLNWIDGTRSKLSGRKSSRSASRKRKAQRRTPSAPFRAVSIHATHEGCAAAQRIKDQRFLATFVPQLPLGGCSNPQQCGCRYRYHTDRRQALRRDSDHGLPSSNYHAVDRRHRRDRRSRA